jgi:hypothetical protein
MTSPQFRRQFDFARTPYDARNALGLDISGYMKWVKYTGPPQSFNQGDVTRDGDWTMVALKATTDRPAPQPSGAEEDLLPAWTPTTSSASGSYSVYNQWTLSSAGWIDQYGIDVLSANTAAQHAVTLQINGTTRDTFTVTPNNAGLLWQNIAPLAAPIGTVIRVTLQVTRTGSNSWYSQAALFATAPIYCSAAVGAKDAATPGTTAYGCHLMFQPGAMSPNWDVVAYSGGTV